MVVSMYMSDLILKEYTPHHAGENCVDVVRPCFSKGTDFTVLTNHEIRHPGVLP